MQLQLFFTRKCQRLVIYSIRSHISIRTKAQVKQFPKDPSYTSFHKKNTLKINHNLLMMQDLPCSEKCQMYKIFMSLLRLYTTVLSLGKKQVNLFFNSPECVIIALVYINRLIAFTGMALAPTNWRPITICSLLVAQKVWDDRYLSNSDFAFIYPFFVTEEINHLESKFLELLQYTVTVKSSLYAKYYFELRSLFKDNQQQKNQKQFPLTPLDTQQAQRLEIRSGKIQDKFYSKTKNSKKKNRTVSLQKQIHQKTKFVIN